MLDLAQARDHARALQGVPPAELLGQVPRPLVVEALRQSLAWYQREEPTSPSGVLNACRALRYAEEGVFDSRCVSGSLHLGQAARRVIWS